MKKKEREQLKTKTAVELEKDLTDLRDKLWNLKTDLASGKVKNVQQVKETKKNIARLLTIVNKSKNHNYE